MADVTLLQPTNMTTLPSRAAGHTARSSTEFNVYRDDQSGYLYGSGTFEINEIGQQGTITHVLIDDTDFGQFPNLSISTSFFMSYDFERDVVGSGRFALFVQFLLEGSDTILGSSGNDHILGYGGNDRLSGGAGGDTLDGGTGSDRLSGGSGDDIFVVDSLGDTVVEAAGQGTDAVASSVSHTLARNVENLTLSGTGNLNGTGNGLANVLVGTAGNNTLDGKAGADTMQGGAGNDSYIVDNPDDIVKEAVGGGTDSVEATVSYTLSRNVETLVLTGTGDLSATGNSDNNTLKGNTGANRLDGGAGKDTLQGGAGNDTYIVAEHGDRVIESANSGADTVRTSISIALMSNVENLVLTAEYGISGTGNALRNTITGNAFENLLDGLRGSDTLIGGGGGDYFSFSTALGSRNVDRIVDFARGEGDKLFLSDEIFAALAGQTALASHQFKDVSRQGPADADDRILYSSKEGRLFYDADGSGTQFQAVYFAILDNKAALTAADILIA